MPQPPRTIVWPSPRRSQVMPTRGPRLFLSFSRTPPLKAGVLPASAEANVTSYLMRYLTWFVDCGVLTFWPRVAPDGYTMYAFFESAVIKLLNFVYWNVTSFNVLLDSCAECPTRSE